MSEQVEILLCEDNKRDADLTMRALKKKNLGNRIIWVKDGEEALDFLFGRNEYVGRNINNNPRVILLDLKMPKVGGLEVLREIRNNPKTKSIPVVVLTSSEEEKDIIQSYELGVNSYIVKPVDFVKFSESISEVGFYWMLLNKVKK